MDRNTNSRPTTKGQGFGLYFYYNWMIFDQGIKAGIELFIIITYFFRIWSRAKWKEHLSEICCRTFVISDRSNSSACLFLSLGQTVMFCCDIAMIDRSVLTVLSSLWFLQEVLTESSTLFTGVFQFLLYLFVHLRILEDLNKSRPLTDRAKWAFVTLRLDSRSQKHY